MKKLILILFVFPFLLTAQHSIKGTFSPAKDFKWAILYQITPTNQVYTAQTSIENGIFEFKLDSTVTKGNYRLVYAIPQEEYNFDIIYNAKEDVELHFSIENGVEFISSTDNMLLADYSKSMIDIGQQISAGFNKNKPSKKELSTLFKKQESTQSEFQKNALNTIAFHFIKANKPYIPKGYEDSTTYVKHLQENYFTHVDFNNSILQSSTFLMDRSLAFIFGVYSNTEDKTMVYKKNVDAITEQLKDSDPTFKISFLKDLWQNFVDVEHVDLANYLSTKHLIPLAKQYKNTSLVNKLFRFKTLSIGSTAPGFSWPILDENEEKLWLSELNVAKNYILIFWSSACSHCLKEIPKLQQLIKEFPETEYKVIAIGLEDDAFGWDIETRKYPEFIHVLGLGKWENDIGNSYDISATPTYFVLDKNKVIVAKPDNFEDLEKILKK